jgi:hypothetical protein
LIRDTSFVKGQAQGLHETGRGFLEEKLAVRDDARGVVDEADQPRGPGLLAVLDERPNHGVDLPHLVGELLAEGQAAFVGLLATLLEQFVLRDQTAEGVRGDLARAQQAALQAGAVKLGLGGRGVVERGQDLFDGQGQGFQFDLGLDRQLHTAHRLKRRVCASPTPSIRFSAANMSW